MTATLGSSFRRAAMLLMLMIAASSALNAQAVDDFLLKEASVSAKIPKRLRTHRPFWGLPTCSIAESYEEMENYVVSRDSATAVPRWITWNLDLASTGDGRLKYRPMIPDSIRTDRLGLVIDECYRWAWRKPYGNTCLVMGQLRKGWFVAVCKKDYVKDNFSLGYRSVAFMIPAGGPIPANIYDWSTSVNVVEAHIGYNLFPKLPSGIQEAVEGMTTYELFCPFQEQDDIYIPEPEPDGHDDYESGDDYQSLR